MRFLLLFLLAATPAAAQLGARTAVTYFGVGANLTDNGALTDRLGDAGYGDLEVGGAGLATGSYQFRERLVFGIEGHTTPSETATAGAFAARLSGRYALANVGYLVYSAPRLKLYPLVGAGYGDLTLRLYEDQDADFGDVLQSPRRGAELASRGWLLNVGVGGDYLVPLRRIDDRMRGLALGLRVGYLAELSSGSWDLFSENEALDSPDATLAGPYVRLLIGFGSSRVGDPGD